MPGDLSQRKRRNDLIHLSEIIDVESVKLDMVAVRKKDAIAELLEVLENSGKIDDKEEILKDLIEREKSSSTGIGDGIAIPHKLVAGLKKTVMVFGRKKEGIGFDSIDGKPVYLFFLILGREGSCTKHLRILSKLARLLHAPAFRQMLLDAETAEEIIDAVKAQDDE